jgi:hypothetical protein
MGMVPFFTRIFELFETTKIQPCQSQKILIWKNVWESQFTMVIFSAAGYLRPTKPLTK